MPPLPLLPNQPTGVPDWYSPTGTASTSTPSSSGRPSWYQSQTLGDLPSDAFPNTWGPDDIQHWIASADQKIAVQQQQLRETTGLERKQIEAKIADLVEGRKNAMEIAQLQADTSRYGTDASKETRLAELKQNQNQFEATHQLDLQKFGLSQQQFGLDTAKAYTEYAKTPDMAWSQADFKDALGRVSQGLGPQPLAANPTSPTPKSWEDFSVLAQYGPNGAPTGQAPGGGAAPGATNANGGPATPTGTGSTADPRMSAANAIMKAIPPSDTVGHDGQDWAALGAIKNLYFAGRPDLVAKLGRPRQQIAEAGLARLGYDPALVREDNIRAGIGQGSPRAA